MDAEGDALRMVSWPFVVLGTLTTLASAVFRWRRVNSKSRTIWKLSLTFLDVSHILLAFGIITYLSSNMTETGSCSAARTLLILGVQDCAYTLLIAAGNFRFIKSPVKLGSSRLSLNRKSSKYHVCVFIVIIVPEKIVAIIVSVLPLLPVTLPDNDATNVLSCLPIYQQRIMESEFSIFIVTLCYLSIAFAFITVISNLMRVYLGERNRVTTPNADFSLRSFTVVKRRLLWLLLVDAISWIAVLTYITLYCYNSAVQSATNGALLYFVISVCIAIHGILSLLGSFISGAIPFPECSTCLKTDTVVYRKLKKLEYMQSKDNGLMYMRAMWTEDESPEHWTGMLKIYNGGQVKLWSKEIIAYGTMRKSQHPNVARCLWTSKDNPFHDVMGVITGEPISPASRIICMDDHNLGTVRDVVAKLEHPLSSECLVRLLLDIAEGLAHLHDVGIVHRQLHTTVIYLKGDLMSEILSASIGDFEMSKTIPAICDKTDQYSFAETTVSEIYEESHCSDDYQIDMQSFALVALELFVVNFALQSNISNPDNITIDPDCAIMRDMIKHKSNGCLRDRYFSNSPQSIDIANKADCHDNTHDRAQRTSISEQMVQMTTSTNSVERDVIKSVNNLPDVVATTSINANPSICLNKYSNISNTNISTSSLCTRSTTNDVLQTSQCSTVCENSTVETSHFNKHPKSPLPKDDQRADHRSCKDNPIITLNNKGSKCESPGTPCKVQPPILNNSKYVVVKKDQNSFTRANSNLFHVKPADNRIKLDDFEIIPESIERSVQRKLPHSKHAFSSNNETTLPTRVGDKGVSNLTMTKCLIRETVDIVGKDRLSGNSSSTSKAHAWVPTFSTAKPAISSSVQHPTIRLGSASLNTRQQVPLNIQLQRDNPNKLELASADDITKSRKMEIKQMVLGHRSKTEMPNIIRAFEGPRRIAWEAGDAWYKSRNRNNSKATNVLAISVDSSECAGESKSALSKARQRLQSAIARRSVRTTIGKLLNKQVPVQRADSGNALSHGSHASTEDREQHSTNVPRFNTTASDISNLPNETPHGANGFINTNFNENGFKERNVVVCSSSVPGAYSSHTSFPISKDTPEHTDNCNPASSIDEARDDRHSNTPRCDLITTNSIGDDDVVSAYRANVCSENILRNTPLSKRYSTSTLSPCFSTINIETGAVHDKVSSHMGKPGKNENSALRNLDMMSDVITAENDKITKNYSLYSPSNEQNKTLPSTSHKRTILAKQNNSRTPFVNRRQSKDVRSNRPHQPKNVSSTNTHAILGATASKAHRGKTIDSNDIQSPVKISGSTEDSVINIASATLSTCSASESLPKNKDAVTTVFSPRNGKYSSTAVQESYTPSCDYVPSASTLKKKQRMITSTIRKRVRCSTPHPNIGRRTGGNGQTTSWSKVKGHHALYSINEHSNGKSVIPDNGSTDIQDGLCCGSKNVTVSPSITEQASTSLNSVEEASAELHCILDTDDSKLMRLRLANCSEKDSGVLQFLDNVDRPICPVEVLRDNIDSLNHEQYQHSEAISYNSIGVNNRIIQRNSLVGVNLESHNIIHSGNLQYRSRERITTDGTCQEADSFIRTSTPFPKSVSPKDGSIARAMHKKCNGHTYVSASPLNIHSKNKTCGGIEAIVQDKQCVELFRRSDDDNSMQSLFQPQVKIGMHESIVSPIPLGTTEQAPYKRVELDLPAERVVSTPGDKINQSTILAEDDCCISKMPEHITLFCRELASHLPDVSFSHLVPPTRQNFRTLKATLAAYGDNYGFDRKLWEILETCWLSDPVPSSREIADKLQSLALNARR